MSEITDVSDCSHEPHTQCNTQKVSHSIQRVSLITGKQTFPVQSRMKARRRGREAMSCPVLCSSLPLTGPSLASRPALNSPDTAPKTQHRRIATSPPPRTGRKPDVETQLMYPDSELYTYKHHQNVCSKLVMGKLGLDVKSAVWGKKGKNVVSLHSTVDCCFDQTADVRQQPAK